MKQDGPQDAKTGGDGEKFRMSERQRVRGTAVTSGFCESRGNLVSNASMPPFIQNLLSLEAPFAFFVYFAVRFLNTGIKIKTSPELAYCRFQGRFFVYLTSLVSSSFGRLSKWTAIL